MSKTTRRDFLKTSGAVTGAALVGIGSVQAGGSGAGESDEHDHPLTNTSPGLVGTWAASPQQATPEAGFVQGFSNQTIRNILRTSVGGSALRIRLTNAFGENSLTIGSVSVGIWDMDANVIQGTTHPVTFGGNRSVTIPSGARIYSDPVSVDVQPEQNIAVSLYTPNPTGPPTTHADPRKTTYITTGNHVDDTGNKAFDSPAAGESNVLTAWFFLDGVDVVNPDTSGAIVCLGDSITDGVASSLDTDSTYPDFLAERINDTPIIEKSVLNAGIGGNRILHDSAGGGENALARLNRDVLTQTEVTDVILFEGINDIGFSEFDEDTPYEAVTAEEIIFGMKQIITRVHTKGLNIYAGTLTPFKGFEYYYPEGEEKRQAVNHWIRTSGAFDGVFDFDKALQDPDNPKQLLPKYDSGDHIHPSDAGYRKLAQSVNLSEIAKDDLTYITENQDEGAETDDADDIYQGPGDDDDGDDVDADGDGMVDEDDEDKDDDGDSDGNNRDDDGDGAIDEDDDQYLTKAVN